MPKRRGSKAPQGPDNAREKRKVVSLNPGLAPSYYANRAELANSHFEFRLRLQEVFEVTGEKVFVKEVATVYFSPAHAKAIAALFSSKVKEFEAHFGEIQLDTLLKQPLPEP